MPFRVTDSATNSNLSSRIGTQQARLSSLREQIASGKRINRVSDDPSGAEAVIQLKTSLAEVEGFRRSANAANQKLESADSALQAYQPVLDRLRAIVGQGLSDTTGPEGRNALAIELESLRQRTLNYANTEVGGEYVFGGTRQNVPPFDPITGAPETTATTAQFVQLEPGATATAVGVTAETIFADATGDIFADLTDAAAALRGTGDPVADKTTLQNTMDRLRIYGDLANIAHSKVGSNMKAVELAQERLENDSVTYEARAAAIESVDIAEAALALSKTDSALQATLQVAAKGRRSLLDYLG